MAGPRRLSSLWKRPGQEEDRCDLRQRISSPWGPAVRLLGRLLPRSDTDERTPLPIRPASRDDLPPAAWSALEAACGGLTVEGLLVIPTTWKRTWRGRQLAMQKRVVAFGERAVGQWMEDGGAGVVECIRIEDLLAIGDRIVLLDGRAAAGRPPLRGHAPVIRRRGGVGQTLMSLQRREASAGRAALSWTAASSGEIRLCGSERSSYPTMNLALTGVQECRVEVRMYRSEVRM
jgi:hypothetical protein